MTEAEQFEKCDGYEGNTMIVFSDDRIALRYIHHRAQMGCAGLIAQVKDTRLGTGMVVMWRDPVEASELDERLANCRWLLEKTLSGESATPVPGQVCELWSDGFSGALNS